MIWTKLYPNALLRLHRQQRQLIACTIAERSSKNVRQIPRTSKSRCPWELDHIEGNLILPCSQQSSGLRLCNNIVSEELRYPLYFHWNLLRNIDVREDIDDSFTAPVAIAFLNSTASSSIVDLVCESLDIPLEIKTIIKQLSKSVAAARWTVGELFLVR